MGTSHRCSPCFTIGQLVFDVISSSHFGSILGRDVARCDVNPTLLFRGRILMTGRIASCHHSLGTNSTSSFLDLNVPIIAPIISPRVFDQPVLLSISSLAPTNDGDGMINGFLTTSVEHRSGPVIHESLISSIDDTDDSSIFVDQTF